MGYFRIQTLKAAESLDGRQNPVLPGQLVANHGFEAHGDAAYQVSPLRADGGLFFGYDSFLVTDHDGRYIGVGAASKCCAAVASTDVESQHQRTWPNFN